MSPSANNSYASSNSNTFATTTMVPDPISIAAENGHWNVVEQLLWHDDSGINVNARNTSGDTPLILLAADQKYPFPEGGEEIIEPLITKGADLNARNNDGYTALFKAAECDNVNLVKILLSKGADVNVRDNEGSTVLYKAAEAGDLLDVMKLLIAEGAAVNVRNNAGFTALYKAAEIGNFKMVELLLDNGAHVDDEITVFSPKKIARDAGIGRALDVASLPTTSARRN